MPQNRDRRRPADQEFQAALILEELNPPATVCSLCGKRPPRYHAACHPPAPLASYLGAHGGKAAVGDFLLCDRCFQLPDRDDRLVETTILRRGFALATVDAGLPTATMAAFYRAYLGYRTGGDAVRAVVWALLQVGLSRADTDRFLAAVERNSPPDV
jgi:hypothetical protein